MRRTKTIAGFVMLVAAAVALASLGGVSGKGSAPKPDGKIINGTKVTPQTQARWGSLAMLVLYRDGGSISQCGGTVIANRWILTAAHCVSESGVTTSAASVYASVGRINVAPVWQSVVNKPREQVTEIIGAGAVRVHPGWDEASKRNDLALIEFSRDLGVPATKIVGPGETLAWGAGQGLAINGDLGPWIGGWGLTDSSAFANPSDDLNEARVPIESDAACVKALPGYDPATMLCGGITDTDGSAWTTNGVDSCQGDSGGPMLAAAGDGSARVVGVVSWGYGCASSRPGAYARVDALRGWIESVTGAGVSGTTTMAPPATTVTGGGGSGGSTTGFTWKSPSVFRMSRLSKGTSRFSIRVTPPTVSTVSSPDGFFDYTWRLQLKVRTVRGNKLVVNRTSMWESNGAVSPVVTKQKPGTPIRACVVLTALDGSNATMQRCKNFKV